MSQAQSKFRKFGAGIAIILAALGYLAYTGVKESQSYYVTIKELRKMGDVAYTRHLRVAGNVQPGSIHQVGTHPEFILVEDDQTLAAGSQGAQPPPAPFKNNSHAPATAHFSHHHAF